LVVAYHLAPETVTGGYVGVDVFFVISGYLITSGLLSRPPVRWGGVAEFWARRVRRLLPAAFAVIATTSLAVWVTGASSQWKPTARVGVESALYLENWNLWQKDADYLGQADAPSLFQHSWSLSIEEQFYLVWPLLILMLAAMQLRHKRSPDGSANLPLSLGESESSRHDFHRRAGLLIGVIFALSLAFSVWLTPRNQAAAYLVTPARVWELALGSLLACFWGTAARWLSQAWLRLALVGCGLAAIAISAATFGDATAFPGYAALLPTLGSAAFIAGGAAPGQRWLEQFWEFKPIKYLGDMSYSVYLWHWPVIMLAPYAVGHYLGTGGILTALAVTLGLSAASYELIEKPFQKGSLLRGRPIRAFAFTAVGMVLFTAVGGGLFLETKRLAEAQVQSARNATAACLGAQSLLDPECATADPHGAELLLPPLGAADDTASSYGNGCHREPGQTTLRQCQFGEAQGRINVVLWGNSHAAQWLPALEALAPELDMRITTHISTSCSPTAPGARYSAIRQDSRCHDLVESELAAIKSLDADLVVISNLTAAPTEDFELHVESAMWILRQLVDSEQPVLIVRDTPRPQTAAHLLECVDIHADHVPACDGPRNQWVTPDPWAEAANRLDSSLVNTLDPTDAICGDAFCYAVLGGVTVFRDSNHITATLARTAAGDLRAPVEAALKRTP
jgi:peptidoglycan/LPS O-acetylase OafA/YrhL